MSRRVSWLGGVSAAVLLVCALVFTMLPAAFAQDTTGGIKVYVKDKSSGSIPNAQLELTSTALLGAKKGETDSAGPTLGGQNVTIKDSTCPTGTPLPPCPANPTRIDFKTMMTGWNPFAAANADGTYNVGAPLTLANRYGHPFLFQTRRTMRLGIRFTF